MKVPVAGTEAGEVSKLRKIGECSLPERRSAVAGEDW